jgi:ATP-dependent exoDNAse (exonuclease V) beta subunit
MSNIFVNDYNSILDVHETQLAIKLVKDTFESILAKNLDLTRVSAPLFVEPKTGLNDDLSGYEKAVSFTAVSSNTKLEIVQSLAKWKRHALHKYACSGIYTDMNAIRPFEEQDNIHSLYVDQWDWEKIITKEESISEEMRILYVALTRAKEKLIITGTTKDHFKELEKKKEILNVYNSNGGRLNPIILKKYISYLDWIELVYLSSDEMKKLIKVNEYSKKDIVLKEEEKEIEIREFDFEKDINFEKYEKEFSWNYENSVATKLPIKSTVSKIKEMQNEGIDLFEISNKEIGIAEIVPKFMEDEEKISASKKGTLMHLFLQKLDLKKQYSKEELENLKQELIAKRIISEDEGNTATIR